MSRSGQPPDLKKYMDKKLQRKREMKQKLLEKALCGEETMRGGPASLDLE